MQCEFAKATDAEDVKWISADKWLVMFATFSFYEISGTVYPYKHHKMYFIWMLLLVDITMDGLITTKAYRLDAYN